jgi:hypothetical protein
MRNLIQLGILLLATTLVLGCSDRTPKPEGVKATFAQQLPAGTPRSVVAEYLDKQHMPHSDCAQPERNCILAKISGGTQINIVRTDYGATFRFDANNQLVSTEIKPYYTGP